MPLVFWISSSVVFWIFSLRGYPSYLAFTPAWSFKSLFNFIRSCITSGNEEGGKIRGSHRGCPTFLRHSRHLRCFTELTDSDDTNALRCFQQTLTFSMNPSNNLWHLIYKHVTLHHIYWNNLVFLMVAFLKNVTLGSVCFMCIQLSFWRFSHIYVKMERLQRHNLHSSICQNLTYDPI